jgi:hypothetical protein
MSELEIVMNFQPLKKDLVQLQRLEIVNLRKKNELIMFGYSAQQHQTLSGAGYAIFEGAFP